MKFRVGHYIELIIYYTALFFMLREWLEPIVQLTSTSFLNVFLYFIVICFILNILQVHILISWAIKFIYICAVNIKIYSGFSPFSSEGIQYFIQDISTNITAIFAFDWLAVTNPMRTFLFFVLIWMLSYLMHHWITVRMSIFYFLVLTIFFIATLDTFTEYDGKVGIITVLLLGLALSAMLYLKRLFLHTGESLDGKKYIGYLLPILLFVSACGVVASVLPKAEPQWADPVPYIKNLTGAGGNGVSKVGIGEDDTQLGGSFIGDDTVVYEIHAKSAQYWRVETKHVYTSKGWESTNSIEVDTANNIPYSIPIGPPEEETAAKVFSKLDATYVIQPYGMKRVETDNAEVAFIFDQANERLTSKISEEEIVLENYSTSFSSPQYSYTALKNPPEPVGTIDSIFLQIPEQMPQRVRDLALEITASKSTPYDKAKEIERYFKSNGFKYETTNVPIPTDEQDYVDQFLFETKRGYCDNFSTSMVMLLRAADIPARWVKGYAEGTEVGSTDDGLKIFEIENNNAHSWVEAYIDGVGWMMFEPTIGFSNQNEIDFDMELDIDVPEEEREEVKREQERLKEEKEIDRVQREENTGQASKGLSKWVWISLLIVSVVITLIIIWQRQKWMPKMVITRQRVKPTNVEVAYERLLKHLASVGIRKRKGETLSEFAERVDRMYETNDMSKITEVYERAIYSKNADISFEEIKESWENLINRSSG